MLHSLSKSKEVYSEVNLRLGCIKNPMHRPSFKINSSDLNALRLCEVQGIRNNPNLVLLLGVCPKTGESRSVEVHLGEFGWNESWNEESSNYPFCGDSVKNFINNVIFDLRYGVVKLAGSN